jgi:hypothetical protein
MHRRLNQLGKIPEKVQASELFNPMSDKARAGLQNKWHRKMPPISIPRNSANFTTISK